MVFTSYIFIFYFLPLVLALYYLVPFRRNLLLLCASYIFYGWWNPWFVLLMLFSTGVDFWCGRVIADAAGDSRRRVAALVTSIVSNLGLLGFFKYFMFIQGNLNVILEAAGMPASPVINIILPIGISFYSFQSLSYTVDVYRGQSPPVHSFLDFACYVSLFPQLIAGPIVRYNTVAAQIVHRSHTLERFSSGVALFMVGLSKKILLANAIGGVADAVFAAESRYMVDAWFGATAFAFQIYFDFSAYSDMAIGLGRMFGFEFPRNFNAPYLADSITEFWRRWHISLSTFLRDYLYIPLGGNRGSARRTYVNLALVMLLGGLWHGANWVFVAWGAYHGLLLIAERWLGKRSLYGALPYSLKVVITFVLVLFSWVLFRSATLGESIHFFSDMFGLTGVNASSALLGASIYTVENFVAMGACVFFAWMPLQSFDWVEKLSWAKIGTLIVLFALALAVMFEQSFNPFLYFQF
jgi:alginate O-acetyltransferase complex protein AlgI